jgi:hypothetical protein
MSDLQLIKESKDGNSKSKLVLWNQYQGLIHKFYNKYYSLFMISEETKEDFIQDSWIAFEETLNRINIERMIEKNCFSFSTVFFYSLLKIKNVSEEQLRKFGQPVNTSQFSEMEEHNFSSEYTSFVSKTSEDFDDFLKGYYNHQLIENYLNIAENDKKEILSLYLQGRKLSEISRFISVKYSRVYASFIQIKKELFNLNEEIALI